jgi:surface antigen
MVEAPRFAAVIALLIGVAACAGVPQTNNMSQIYESRLVGGEIETPSQPLKCVVYARERSGIAIYGDAQTWWGQAANRYARSPTPQAGAVLVLAGYAGSDRGHLAVVRKVVSARQIRVDHANWLNDGRIYLDDPVVDVSPKNDWSAVRVYNLRDQSWGLRTYGVQGFIASQPADQTQLARGG